MKVDQGTQQDEQGADWSDWTIGRALKILHSGNQLLIRRTLRKLHVRLWHAGIKKMTELLRTAGAPPEALKLIEVIVDTCPARRRWQRPSARNMTTAKIISDFNVEIECDLLFWKTNIILHMVDVCVRWSAAGVCQSRETADTLAALTHNWLRIFGPMTRLVSDHEGALDSDYGRSWADRWSVKLVLRARGAHARLVEKHNDLL